MIKSELEIKLKESISDDLKINKTNLFDYIYDKIEFEDSTRKVIDYITKKLNSKKSRRVIKVFNLIVELLKRDSNKFEMK